MTRRVHGRTPAARWALCALLGAALTGCGDDSPVADPDAPDAPCTSGECADAAPCVPACGDRECGADSCGGTCGPGCDEGSTCSTEGRCVPDSACTPVCGDHECGADQCGGTCGPGCGADEACDGAGRCGTVPDPYTVAPTPGVDTSHWSVLLSEDEIACFLAEGTTHLVVGMTVPYLGRQQLLQGIEAGMTVDAYLYLYWNTDIAAEVGEAMALVADLPIRHFWLDVEEPPGGLGATELADKIQAGLDACAGLPCGIYSSWGFWTSYMVGITRFADKPLWYAHYDELADMSDWATMSFGGWVQPAAKQYTNTVHWCGVTLDRDLFYLEPTAVDERHPLSPTGLAPASEATVANGSVALSFDPIADALRYELEIWHWGGQWYAFDERHELTTNQLTFAPRYPDTRYRWRVRATNTHGVGHWSDFAILEVGEADPAPGAPPPAPRGLFPWDGLEACTESVELEVNAWPGATQYEWVMESGDGTTWTTYATWTTTTSTKDVSPQLDGVHYRFKVRARNAAGWGAYSDWATFHYTPACPTLP